MNLRLLILLAALGGAFPTAAIACERNFDVTGTLVHRLDDGRLIISHDEIPGYMVAMTMAFNVAADDSSVAPLKVGDHLKFRFCVNHDKSSAGEFVVTGHTPPPAPAPAPAVVRRSSRLRAGDAVPAFALVDETGAAFTQEALLGRFTVVTFIFTRCPVPEFCPAMALKFGALQSSLVAQPAAVTPVRLMSITLDPEFDDPEMLTAYGKAIGAQPAHWGFATGAKAQIDALAKAFAVFSENNGVTLDHTLCTALIGPDGRVIELWRGHAWKPAEILSALTPAIAAN
ncbi:MAG: SCO family protein [Verrucomicrobiota bacterium]